jgi:Sec-independent protein translocase protein TatA
MSDLYAGMLLVVSVMGLIFFGPELGKTMGRKFIRSRRRIRRSRIALKKGQRVRTRRISLVGHLAHS